MPAAPCLEAKDLLKRRYVLALNRGEKALQDGFSQTPVTPEHFLDSGRSLVGGINAEIRRRQLVEQGGRGTILR